MNHPREGKGYTPSNKAYRSRNAAYPALTQAQIAFRATPDLKDRLFKEAKRRGVSASYLVEKALIDKLDEWEHQTI